MVSLETPLDTLASSLDLALLDTLCMRRLLTNASRESFCLNNYVYIYYKVNE